ncbi:hypothetical protein F5Y06DRAFT_292218 [Hypoxylon sp. FL0890]|nr:hypothetical protein F5Y06DRAFT_292218 [Hypoxylon sp. FL0890]
MVSPTKNLVSFDEIIAAQDASDHAHTDVNSQQATTSPPATERSALLGDQPQTPTMSRRAVTPDGRHLMTPGMRRLQTPTSIMSRPMNPTPGNSNNWVMFTSPITPADAQMRRFTASGCLSGGRNAPSSISPGSIRRTVSPSDEHMLSIRAPDDSGSSPIDNASSFIDSGPYSPPYGRITPGNPRQPEAFNTQMPYALASSLFVNPPSPTGSTETVVVHRSQDARNILLAAFDDFVEYVSQFLSIASHQSPTRAQDGTESDAGVDVEAQSQRSGYGTFPENENQRPASCWNHFNRAQINTLMIGVVVGLVVVGALVWALSGVLYY